ncbi:hypothetical protein [Phenylobacterium conjunctum]|uniref:YCII-related domain-containing protein n=1 Tax=Phenylobacterium conjunctum TaxID=1298959 RepID=A0ABW3T602_9CAUL
MKTFLALFMGDPNPVSGPPEMSEADMARGMEAWGAWMANNAARIVDAGGPVGVNKTTDKAGVHDARNQVGGYVILTAESHDEAARLFLDHPHFTIFPGDRVEIMERLPIPGAA